MWPRTSRWLVQVVLVALLLPSCSSDTDDSSFTTHGPYDVTMTVVSHETTQKMSVFAPEADGSWPVGLMLHCYECDRSDAAPMAAQLASHGMVVFAPDYRSTDSWETVEQDVECSYRYARTIAAEHGGDLDQPVTFVGDSLGASWVQGVGVGETYYGPGGGFGAVCFTGPPRPDVVVAIGGCYYEYEGSRDVLPVIDLMAESTDTAKLDSDLILVVGENDDTCHAWQSEDATAALQAAGYDAELRVMPGGDHHNVVFWAQEDGEWVIVPDDPVGQQVVQTILDAIDAAQP